MPKATIMHAMNMSTKSASRKIKMVHQKKNEQGAPQNHADAL